MSVCCECCVLSGRGLCDWLITCTEKSYGLFYGGTKNPGNVNALVPWGRGGGGGCRPKNKRGRCIIIRHRP